ncbi:ALP1-like protein [Tanacetum coccineum]
MMANLTLTPHLTMTQGITSSKKLEKLLRRFQIKLMEEFDTPNLARDLEVGSRQKAALSDRTNAFNSSDDGNSSRVELRELPKKSLYSFSKKFWCKNRPIESYVDKQDRVCESKNGWMQSLDDNAGGIKVVDGTKGLHSSTLVMTQTQGNNDLHGATDVRIRVIHQHIGTDIIMYSYERNHGNLMEFEDGLDMATVGFILDDSEKLKRWFIVFAVCTLNDLDHHQIAALASCFIRGDKSSEQIQLISELSKPLQQLQDSARRIAEVENDLKKIFNSYGAWNHRKWVVLMLLRAWVKQVLCYTTEMDIAYNIVEVIMVRTHSSYRSGCLTRFVDLASLFGVFATNTDINGIRQSMLFNDLKAGKAQEVRFQAKNVTYKRRYYLVEVIYPEWDTLVMSISHPGVGDTKQIRYKKAQEASKKDVEQTFDQKRAISLVSYPKKQHCEKRAISSY